MTYDLVLAARADLAPTDVVLAVDAADEGRGSLFVQADRGHRVVIVTDPQGGVVAYIGPTRPVHDPAVEGARHGLGEVAAEEEFWTELAAPEARDLDFLRSLADHLARAAGGRVLDPLDPLGIGSALDADDPGTDQLTVPTTAPFDVLGEEEAVVVWRRPVVALGPWLTHLLLEAEAAERRLVVLTPPSARLTPATERLVRQGVVRWLVDDGTLTTEPRLGRQVRWSGEAFEADDAAPPTLEAPADGAWVLHLDLEGLHPYPDPQVGQLLEQVVAALGVGPVERCGLMEPAEASWDPAVVGEAARLSSPHEMRVIAAGPGVDAVLTVVPQPSGATERVELVADAPAEPLSEEGLHELGVTLAGAGAQLALVCYRWSTEDRLVGAGGMGPLVPGLLVVDTARFRVPQDQVEQTSRGRAREVGGHLVVPFPPPEGEVTLEMSREVWDSWYALLALVNRHDEVQRLAGGDGGSDRPGGR